MRGRELRALTKAGWTSHSAIRFLEKLWPSLTASDEAIAASPGAESWRRARVTSEAMVAAAKAGRSPDLAFEDDPESQRRGWVTIDGHRALVVVARTAGEREEIAGRSAEKVSARFDELTESPAPEDSVNVPPLPMIPALIELTPTTAVIRGVQVSMIEPPTLPMLRDVALCIAAPHGPTVAAVAAAA